MRSRATLMMGAALALGSVGAVALPAPAGAQTCPSTYTPSTCVAVTLSASIVAPGGTITITGGGFLAFSIIVITFHTTPVTLATVRADANGNFSVTVTIPASATPGSHFIEASGTGANGQPLTLTTPITIASVVPVSTNNQSTQTQASQSRPTSTTGQLPFTGTDLALTVGTGGVLVVAGAAAIAASRRRDQARLSRTD